MIDSCLLVALSTPEGWDDDTPVIVMDPASRAETHRIATVAIRMGRRWNMATHTRLESMRFAHWLLIYSSRDLQRVIAGVPLPDEESDEDIDADIPAADDGPLAHLQVWLNSYGGDAHAVSLTPTMLATLSAAPTRSGMRVDGVTLCVGPTRSANGSWRISFSVLFKNDHCLGPICDIDIADLLNVTPEA